MTAGRGTAATDAFLRAIDLEIEAILTRSDADAIPLRQGTRTGSDGDEIEYVFEARPKADIARQSLIRSSTQRGRWERAVAAVLPDGKVRVTTSADLGHESINARLREDDTVAFDQLAERVSAAGRAGGPNLTTAGFVLGLGVPRISRHPDVGRLIGGYRSLPLNDLQRHAIDQALACAVTFIWGPPGTGKTEVVSRIVEGSVRQGLRVLFLSPTNIAVDQAVERICVLLQHDDGFEQGLVQRAGDIALPSLQRRFGAVISPNQIVDRAAGALARRFDQVTADLAVVRASLALHDRAAAAERRFAAITAEREPLERRAEQADIATRQLDEQARTAQQERVEMGEPGGLFAQRRRRRIEALEADVDHYRAAAERARADRNHVVAELATRRVEHASAGEEVRRCRQQLDGVEPSGALRQRERRLTDDLAQVEKERRELANTVRARCRVLGTTVQKAVQSRSLMASVDVVVIDEAGMVGLPWAWCAAGLAAERVVVAGDFRQLPAVTHGSGNDAAAATDRQHSRVWMDRDAFTAAGLVDAHGTVRSDARMVRLDTQYRMRTAICAVVNEVAYPDAPLRTGRGEAAALGGSALLPGPVVLVDTSSRRMPVGRLRAHLSNAVHEAVVHELVRGLQHDRVLPTRKATGPSPTDRMAVITPYRDQASVLQKSLRYRFGTDFDGFADTVHRFQGSQRPIVVVDTVAGAGEKAGRFYDGSGLSSQTCRLLNVMLSRAEDHLVVVADVDFLDAHVTPGSEVARMLAHLRQHADRLSVDDLVPVRSAADLAGLADDDLVRPAFFPADEVPRAVLWDIARARQSVEVYSAFLDPRPVRTWLQHFATVLAGGVRVTVYTRPHEPGSTAAVLVHELIDKGCRVETRERMHEKVMIIDDAVLWHGSLNLLANNGPTDLMMRLTDPTACARVQQIMSVARMERPARTWNGVAARAAPTGSAVRPGDVVAGRLYLNVPFDDKDEAKRLVAARWDNRHKLWHVPGTTPRERVARWLPSA